MAGYTGTTTGLEIQFMDFRLGSADTDIRPQIPPGREFLDTEFGFTDAIPDPGKRDGVEWKRPRFISDNPQLFTSKATRFDIGQGEAGTCWFLSMVTHLVEHPAQFKEVVPDDAYFPGPDCDGVFHARFWRFGQWHDVYVDDYLPVKFGRPWGAHSVTDPNEFWVSLLEKAFARYHGSYQAVYGGACSDAYVALTGGVSEVVEYEGPDAGVKFFKRVRNALNAQRRGFVAAAVPAKHNNQYGLIGAHAYTINGTAEVGGTRLFRIRNPWGEREWTGPWSDTSSEYQRYDWPGKAQAKDDGEFWMDVDTFLMFFVDVTVCNLTPDFDQDGKPDALKYVINMFGEWSNSGWTAGGPRSLNNPRYSFTIPESGMQEVPTVVQLIQKRKSRRDPDVLSVRCDVYKVLNASGPPSVVAKEDIDKENTFWGNAHSSYRYVLSAGTYLIVPATMQAGQEKNFLVRLFTPVPVNNVREVPVRLPLKTGNNAPVPDGGGKFDMDNCSTLPAAWKVGAKNAGGQIRHRETHATNPQFAFTVDRRMAVRFTLNQEEEGGVVPLGLVLYPYPEDGNPRAISDINEIYKMAGNNEHLMNTDGHPYVFINNATSIESTYVLNPGRYTLLIHTEDPGVEKDLVLVVMSSAPVKIQGFNTGA